MSDHLLFSEPGDDQWDWWRLAWPDPRKIGKPPLLISEGHPQVGFYRVRGRDGDWQTVAFFRDAESGIMRAERNGKPVPESGVNDLWLWAARMPISFEVYERAMTGGGWADEPERAPGIGDNIGEADPHDALMIEYLGEKELVEAFLKTPITSKDEADRASIWASRMREIKVKADALHKIEKQPSIDEGRRVDEHWRTLREDSQQFAVTLKKHQQAWFDEQDRLERERVWKAQQEAERLRKIAAEEARRADEANDIAGQADAGKLISEAQEKEREAIYRRPQAGRTNAKTSLRTVRTGRIVDPDAFLMAIKNRSEVKALMQSIANQLAKSQLTVAGMEIEESKRVV